MLSNRVKTQEYSSRFITDIEIRIYTSSHLSYNMDKSNEKISGNRQKTVHLSVHPKKKTLVSI